MLTHPCKLVRTAALLAFGLVCRIPSDAIGRGLKRCRKLSTSLDPDLDKGAYGFTASVRIGLK